MTRRGIIMALAGIVVAAMLVAASTWRVYINTWDEPEHLAAGLQLLNTGHYTYDIQHPPLARVAIALGPWVMGAKSLNLPPPDGKPEGLVILYGEGHYWSMLSAARAGTLPFLGLLIVMTYLWARQQLAAPESLVAAALVASLPPILGHAGLATIDIAATATVLTMLYAWRHWLERPNWSAAIWMGLASGLALGVKLSAIPFGAIGMAVLTLIDRIDTRSATPPASPTRATRALQLTLMTGLVAVILTLAYGGGFEYLTGADHKFNQALYFLFGKTGRLHDIAYTVFAWFEVPVAFQWYLGGIEALTVHNQAGHLSYLLGQSRLDGWWYFYLVALWVKTPLPIMLVGLWGWFALGKQALNTRRVKLITVPALALALLLFASVYSHINIGVRHVLIIYPLLMIGAAHTLAQCFAHVHTLSGLGRSLALAAVALFLAQPIWTVLHEWPDYLPYFNATVTDPEQVLVDSDLDWGQDLARLSQRLAQLHVPEIAIAYSGSAVMANEHLPPYTLLAPDQRAVGWVAVSALARVDAPHKFSWLNLYTPIERVGKTIDLYYIPALH